MKTLWMLAAIAALGCGGDSTAPLPGLAGTWRLQTIAGSPLPFAFDVSNSVASDVFVLRADGTMTETYTGIHVGGTFTTTSSGTWSFSGDILNIQNSGFVFTQGVPDPVTHQTISFVLNNQIWLYARQ